MISRKRESGGHGSACGVEIGVARVRRQEIANRLPRKDPFLFGKLTGKSLPKGGLRLINGLKKTSNGPMAGFKKSGDRLVKPAQKSQLNDR